MTLVSIRHVIDKQNTELEKHSSRLALNTLKSITNLNNRYHVGLTPLDLTSWRPDALLPSTTWEL